MIIIYDARPTSVIGINVTNVTEYLLFMISLLKLWD